MDTTTLNLLISTGAVLVGTALTGILGAVSAARIRNHEERQRMTDREFERKDKVSTQKRETYVQFLDDLEALDLELKRAYARRPTYLDIEAAHAGENKIRTQLTRVLLENRDPAFAATAAAAIDRMSETLGAFHNAQQQGSSLYPGDAMPYETDMKDLRAKLLTAIHKDLAV